MRGKTLTSYPEPADRHPQRRRNDWVDEEVVVSAEGGWPLVTSRNPDDLDAFCQALVEQVAQA